MLDVYIGNLEDPNFKWDEAEWTSETWNGNVPKRRSPFFPNGSSAWYRLVRKIDQGELDGKQVDFGGFVARMTKGEIEAFLNEVYGELEQQITKAEATTPDGVTAGRVMAIREYLRGLEDEKRYALCAVEL